MAESQPDKNKQIAAAQEFLLQEHRMLLTRMTTIRISMRAMLLAVVAFESILRNPLISQVTAAVIVATLLSYFWLVEERSIRFRLYSIQEMLVRAGPPDWEDFYIRSRYQSSFPGFWLALGAEVFAWWLVVIGIAMARVVPLMRL